MSGQVPEQPVLFSVEDDSALLLPVEQIRKRYTAEQAEEIERLRDAVLMLLSSWPVEAICRHLRLTQRTVRALAAHAGEKVTGLNKEFAEILTRTGARWIALARTKEDEASPKDLAIMAGIVMQHARELAAMGQFAGEKETKEDQDHLAAAAALRRLMDQPSDQAPASIDSQSTDAPLNDNGLRQISQFGAVDGAGEDLAGRPSSPLSRPPEHLAPGGGSDPGSAAGTSMPPSAEGIQPKADPSAEKSGEQKART